MVSSEIKTAVIKFNLICTVYVPVSLQPHNLIKLNLIIYILEIAENPSKYSKMEV